MTAKKTILIVAPLPPPYHGMATATKMLCNSKVKDYFQLEIINTNSSVLKQQWRFNLKRIGQILKSWGVFLCKLAKYRPHLVYLTIAQSKVGFLKDSFFVVLAKLFRRKTVVHFHGGLFELTYQQSNWLLQRLMAYLLDLNDVIIVLTDSLKSLTKGIIKEEKVWVIPNAVDRNLVMSERETAKIFQKLKEQKKRVFTILYFSNLIMSKGYFDILKAACELKTSDFKFLFVGSWPDQKERQEAENFVNNNHIAEIVSFIELALGDTKKELFMNSDIFVLPTYYSIEGLPISLLEAMACGLPVITTRYRGIQDVVSEGQNGFFVPAQDPIAIAEKIKLLSLNPQLRLKIAKNNIEKINSNFTENIFANKFIAQFNTLLRSRN